MTPLQTSSMSLQDENRTLLLEKQKSAFFSLHWMTVSIVLAQMTLCTLAWTFAALMMRKVVQLPDSNAIWIQNNPSDVNVIVTLVSTLLSLTSSFLLGRAVQYALVRRLSDAPLRLDTMMQWTNLAQRSLSLNFDKHRLSWTLSSVLLVALVSFLTTAWSSLLTPESVVVYYDLLGSETNFLNPTISTIFSSLTSTAIFAGISQPMPGYNLTPHSLPLTDDPYFSSGITGGLADAGHFAALAVSSSFVNLSEPTNFINLDTVGSPYVCNLSTGGIYPSGNLSIQPTVFWETGLIDPPYLGLSTVYNATQHGFTANVSRRWRGSDDPVITPNLMGSVLINTSIYDDWYINTYSWTVNCSDEVEYATIGVSSAATLDDTGYNTTASGLLMTSVCFGQDFTGPSNQSFLFLFDSFSDSRYTFTPQICQVTPLVTTVQAVYDQSIINVLQQPLEQHTLPDPEGNSTAILMWLPALMIWSSFVSTQGFVSNANGDNLLSLPNQEISSGEINTDLEAYLCGMMEYLGSVMAYSVSFAYKPNMTVPFNGTANVRTFGWTFHLRTDGPALVAITLVTLLTIAFGVWAMLSMERDRGEGAGRGLGLQRTPDSDTVTALFKFDPTNTMDMLLASSVGDLGRVLSEMDARGRGHGEKEGGGKEGGGGGGSSGGAAWEDGAYGGLRVVLARTDEGEVALRTVDGEMREDSAGDLDLDLERRGFLSSGDLEHDGRMGVEGGQ